MPDLLAETVAAIRPVSAEARAAARERLDRMTKPRGSLGRVEDIAVRHHTTRGMLASLNGLRRDESIRPGTVLLVPAQSRDLPAVPRSVYNDLVGLGASGRPDVGDAHDAELARVLRAKHAR